MNLIVKGALFLGLILLILPSFSQSALEYMNEINAETKKIQSDMWDYTSAVAHGKSARKVEKKRVQLLKTSKEALERVKAMPDYDGSVAYRDSVVNFLSINYMVLKVDYARITEMEANAEQSFENMEAYLQAMDVAGEKMQYAGDMVREEQMMFASRNNITLRDEENKLSENIKIANAVYEHYNQVYLIFFKSYKSEVGLVSSISAKNLTGMKSNQEKLRTNVAEGLLKLKAIEAYKGDNSCVTACQEVLTFYQEEAEKVNVMIEFYEKNKSFNEVVANFEKIKAKKRTQDDIDTYNNAVNEYNALSEEYNKTNEELNKERQEQLEEWNKTIAKFTDKHVP